MSLEAPEDLMRADLRPSLDSERHFFVCRKCLPDAPDHRGPGGSVASDEVAKCRTCGGDTLRLLNYGRWRDVVGWSVMAGARALFSPPPEPRRLPIVEPRSCGECSACCEVMGVDELKKPPRVRCEHQREPNGCAIYEDRPPSCAEFRCLWHVGGGLSEAHRPDRFGVLLDAYELRDTETGEKKVGIRALEVFPSGFMQARIVLSPIARELKLPMMIQFADGSEYAYDGDALGPWPSEILKEEIP